MKREDPHSPLEHFFSKANFAKILLPNLIRHHINGGAVEFFYLSVGRRPTNFQKITNGPKMSIKNPKFSEKMTNYVKYFKIPYI